MALGINNVVGISGTFIGLVLGGLLAPINWRLIFLVSVPIGLVGTIWSYRSLREIGVRTRDPIDWAGNITFAVGLMLVMVGITYGIEPYGGHPMGWTSPDRRRVPRSRRGRLLGPVRLHRAALGGADVPAPAVPDPRLHLRRPRRASSRRSRAAA